MSSFQRKGELQIAEAANRLIDPVLARKAGINTALIGSWDEIAGADFAECTRPEKITWPRANADRYGDAGGVEPGVLTIACEGARALFLAHAQGELIQRINGFFGYPAIRQVRIVQKPVSMGHKHRPKPRPLTRDQQAKLTDMTADIDNEKLKAALERLGRGVMGRRVK
ncbi:hypothetical protein M2360_003871 [Rhizobium sp. SG_E_25_P2]|jgi:hypothetical protein|uniref:DUF721 domain-containing protein n=1 Tax=Rhizobium sp. SG_E_25_P2 TaxID=2879942 RepID=UPI0024734EBC|nr:DciA family protein [Rhizobium sp. SG_E_25_P2]MDH6268465.1 hypothetical protein [Rhizobium sp. SG_E_25_P2]